MNAKFVIPSAEHSDRSFEMYVKRIEIDIPLLLLSNMPPLVVFFYFFFTQIHSNILGLCVRPPCRFGNESGRRVKSFFIIFETEEYFKVEQCVVSARAVVPFRFFRFLFYSSICWGTVMLIDVFLDCYIIRFSRTNMYYVYGLQSRILGLSTSHAIWTLKITGVYKS